MCVLMNVILSNKFQSSAVTQNIYTVEERTHEQSNNNKDITSNNYQQPEMPFQLRILNHTYR